MSLFDPRAASSLKPFSRNREYVAHRGIAGIYLISNYMVIYAPRPYA